MFFRFASECLSASTDLLPARGFFDALPLLAILGPLLSQLGNHNLDHLAKFSAPFALEGCIRIGNGTRGPSPAS
jgi:hypothetical protein